MTERTRNTPAAVAGVPKHERLRQYLLGELTAGRLKPGDALPTEQQLTVSEKMSRNTVRQALAELERSGLIRRVPGRGTFVHESATARLRSGLDAFALVIPDTRTGFYPSLQRGFHQASEQLNNQVIVCDTNNDPNRQAAALLQLIDQEVAGVAIVPTTVDETPRYQIRPLHLRGIPVVFCHRRVEGITAPLVTFSATEVGRMGATALLQRGHQRLAFFSPTRGGMTPGYQEGFQRAVREAGRKLPEPVFCVDDAATYSSDHVAVVRRSLQQVMAGSDRPTGLFCTFDTEAEIVYFELAAMGIRVPDEVSLVGFGGRWREGAMARRLVSVTVDEEELARKSVRLLDEMRRRVRPLDDGERLELPLELSAGETLAEIHAR
ncbi:MAG: LacI family DNA-binding transcriptional regulator [Verrucomicrobia bacterium]|nr:LacI family DNA-binding transcriptional regulator [Verrucomicrobiota bacterium]